MQGAVHGLSTNDVFCAIGIVTQPSSNQRAQDCTAECSGVSRSKQELERGRGRERRRSSAAPVVEPGGRLETRKCATENIDMLWSESQSCGWSRCGGDMDGRLDGCQGALIHATEPSLFFPLPSSPPVQLSIDIQVTFNYARRRENCEVLATRG